MYITVYGASSGKVAPEYREAAFQLGQLMAQRHHTLINGAGRTGLMGATTEGVLSMNGSAIGVIPQFMIGYATREVMILEFSSTVVALILAGKVGSNIASEIGTMRITEQIDALEIMGVNSASYLILPKVVATVLFFPLLTLFSIFVGIVGGYAIAYLTGIMLPGDYIEGLFYCFEPFSFTYALVKGAVFAFIITSISAYCGYYAKGNSLEVGRASTRAVVASSITIMIFDLILTRIMRV
jgi:phospholipid/cholesterol/gamma-HCH transport system permease protein